MTSTSIVPASMVFDIFLGNIHLNSRASISCVPVYETLSPADKQFGVCHRWKTSVRGLTELFTTDLSRVTHPRTADDTSDYRGPSRRQPPGKTDGERRHSDRRLG